MRVYGKFVAACRFHPAGRPTSSRFDARNTRPNPTVPGTAPIACEDHPNDASPDDRPTSTPPTESDCCTPVNCVSTTNEPPTVACPGELAVHAYALPWRRPAPSGMREDAPDSA